MIILDTKINEREGNDVWIRDAWFLVEDNGKRYALLHKTVTGWSNEDSWADYSETSFGMEMTD